jgi:hypothetical protein
VVAWWRGSGWRWCDERPGRGGGAGGHEDRDSGGGGAMSKVCVCGRVIR